MNHRQRILALLNRRTPDRVPWLADLDYWTYAMQQRGELPAGFRSTPDYIALNRQLNAGFYLQGYFPFKAIYDETIEVETWMDGNRRFTRLEMPAGALTSEWVYLPESFSEAPVERYLKTAADIPLLRYVFEHTHYQPDYDLLRERIPLLHEGGVLLAYLPRSPFMQLVTELSSIEDIVTLWLEAQESFEDLLRVMEGKHDEAARIALASPAECLMIPENLSSEVVGKRFYNLYLRPYETRWVERIRRAGKFSFIHMDGTLRGLLREVSSVGFDVIEAVTPAPVGDLTFAEMRQLAGPGQILWGGVPGVYFTGLVDDTEFDRLVREGLAVMTRAPNFVLGVADQVPPNGLRQRILRTGELVEQYGHYI